VQGNDVYLAVDWIVKTILTSDKVPAQEQLDRVADIRTLQAQLSKSATDKTVAQKLWSSIETIGKVGAFVAFVERVASLMHSVL